MSIKYSEGDLVLIQEIEAINKSLKVPREQHAFTQQHMSRARDHKVNAHFKTLLAM